MRKHIIDSSKKTRTYIQKELERGRSAKEIATEFNVVLSTFYAYTKKHNITYVLKYPRGIDEGTAMEIVDYIKKHPYQSNQEIQQKFLISYYQLKQILDIHGISKQNLRVREVKWTPTQERIVNHYLKDTAKNHTEIARALGVTRMMVCRVIRKYKEVGECNGYTR